MVGIPGPTMTARAWFKLFAAANELDLLKSRFATDASSEGPASGMAETQRTPRAMVVEVRTEELKVFIV